MFERIKNSWELIKASVAVLWADKELIVFPIVSAIGVLVVTVSFMFPMFLAGLFDSLLLGQFQVLGIGAAFIFYLVQYFVIIFANAALIGAVMIRLGGGDPTVGDGFRIAMEHIGSIVGYALISATVGVVLRLISQRKNIIWRIAASIFGLAWNLASFLVVPVIVDEGIGPIEAIKKSTNLLKETWGEQIVGKFSIGLIFGPLMFLTFLLGFPVIALAVSTNSVLVIALAFLGFVLLLVFMGLINSTLSGIYGAALYRYAVEGDAGEFFSDEMVRGAFRLDNRWGDGKTLF
jgi:hypothetical protein